MVGTSKHLQTRRLDPQAGMSNFLRESTLSLSPNVGSILSALFKAQALPALGAAGSGSGTKSTSATRCRPSSIPLSFE